MVTISDTTLRDGAQGEGVSFSPSDKRQILLALDQLGIRWVEAGNPGANPQDEAFFESLRGEIPLRNASLLAFGATCRAGLSPEEDPALVKLRQCPTDVRVIFGKCALSQVTHVLRTTPEENLRMIEVSTRYLAGTGQPVWFDAEHFFDGYLEDADYAMKVLERARLGGAARIILCDTRGGCLPEEISEIVRLVREKCPLPLGIHCHNDCGLAVACSVAAVQAGCDLVQGTMGGIGERCGNADLCTIIPLLSLKMGIPCLPEHHLNRLTHISRQISEIMNLVPNENAPFVGHSAFAHKAGMHIDAVIKDGHSYEHIAPEAVGNQRRFLVSEQSGRAGLYARLGRIFPELNIDSPEIGQVIRVIREKEAQGYTYENADSSFELLALDTLRRRPLFYRVMDYHVLCQRSPESSSLRLPTAQAYLKVDVNGQQGINAAEGDGPVNALDLALRKTLSLFYPSLSRMSLKDFKVRVLNSRGTASLVRVSIESSDGTHIWNTVGVSENIIEACLFALIDSVDYMLLKYVPKEEIFPSLSESREAGGTKAP